MSKRDLTMLTDFYEMTMANGFFEKGVRKAENFQKSLEKKYVLVYNK